MLISGVGHAQPISPFNDLAPTLDSSGNYSFWISGHFYGGSSNASGYPVNTLLGNLDMFNGSSACMMISLGDLFKDVRNDIPFYRKSLFSKLQLPLYNAVGNHDISGDVYQENFGKTFFSFRLHNDMHVVLDSELDDGDIQDEQLDMLKEIATMTQDGEIKNVFIYAHRTMWKDAYDDLDNILNDNTQSLMKNNFEADVLPVLRDMSKNVTVYWFGGSLGNTPFSFLHYPAEANITFICTAIRGLPRDAVLLAHSQNGKISFETVSLTGQELMQLQDYTVEKWETTSPHEPFNWRLLPLYIKQTIISWSFFFGAFSMLMIVVVLRLIFKKRRRNKPLS